MEPAVALVKTAASSVPVQMSEVLTVPQITVALAPHLRGLTREEGFDEVRHLLEGFREECERKDSARTAITALHGELDDEQMALVVVRLILLPPVSKDDPDGYAGVTVRRATALTLTGFAEGGKHDNSQRLRRIESVALFGAAFTREFVRWLEQIPAPQVTALSDFVTSSRIAHDAKAEAFDDLEVFVDGDPTVARLVAAGLCLPQSPTFDVAYAELRLLAADWEEAGRQAGEDVPGTPQTQAAMTWLSRLLGDEENLGLAAFASLPEGFTASLDLLTEERLEGVTVETLSRLIAASVVDEVEPERYMMPEELYRRISPVVQRVFWSDGVGGLLAPLVDYYEPRLLDVAKTVELDRLSASATYRRGAGYSVGDHAPLEVSAATAWWEDERQNVLVLSEALRVAAGIKDDPKDDSDEVDSDLDLILLLTRLSGPAHRIARAMAAAEPAELVDAIRAERTEAYFDNRQAIEALREFDELQARQPMPPR